MKDEAIQRAMDRLLDQPRTDERDQKMQILSKELGERREAAKSRRKPSSRERLANRMEAESRKEPEQTDTHT